MASAWSDSQLQNMLGPHRELMAAVAELTEVLPCRLPWELETCARNRQRELLHLAARDRQSGLAAPLATRDRATPRALRLRLPTLRFTLVLGALLTELLSTAGVRAAEVASAAECATDSAKVGYTVVYDDVLEENVISGVNVSGISIACDGRTVNVVLTKGGIPVHEHARIVVIGTVEILCDAHSIPAASVDGANVYLSTVAP